MKSTLKILFADDDLKYSLVLKRFLEREGYEVTYTGNGTMALEQFPVVKPDLVLLDINMPGLNGFEVAEKIREQDRHVLIFFLSDRSDKNDRLKGFSRILTQKSTKSLFKGKPGHSIYLHLIHFVDILFYRILDRGNIHILFGKLFQNHI